MTQPRHPPSPAVAKVADFERVGLGDVEIMGEVGREKGIIT